MTSESERREREMREREMRDRPVDDVRDRESRDELRERDIRDRPLTNSDDRPLNMTRERERDIDNRDDRALHDRETGNRDVRTTRESDVRDREARMEHAREVDDRDARVMRDRDLNERDAHVMHDREVDDRMRRDPSYRRTTAYDPHTDRGHWDREGGKPAGFHLEHTLAWLFGLGSIVLLVIGALTAFNVINLHTVDVQGSNVSGGSAAGSATQHFLDGALFMLPALTAAFIAMTWHMSEHHVRGGSREAMFSAEHGISYIGVLASIAFAAIGIGAGYDVLSKGYTQLQGITWTLVGLTSSVLATGFHAVGHHVMAREAETEDIRQIVEERVGRALERAGAGLANDPGTERAR